MSRGRTRSRKRALGLLAAAWFTGCVAPGRYVPGHYAWDTSLSAACRQNPAYCTAPAGEEPLLSPAVVTGLTVAATTAGATAVTVLEFNDQEREAIEQVLLRCAQEAERKVNRRALGEDRPPRRDECRKLVLVTREQAQRFLDQGRLHEFQRTFVPDIVIIFDGNAFWIQAVYDFKFPCPDTNGPRWNSYPDTIAFRGSTQDEVYRDALKVDPLFVTPKGIF
jgi:hypothetical protein